MAKIETAEAAQRLAAAILADIRLYNPEAIANGTDLSSEIEEGRALFQGRVTPDLYSAFEAAVASSGLRTQRIDSTAQHREPIATPALKPTSPSANANAPWIAIGIIGLAGTIAWQLLR